MQNARSSVNGELWRTRVTRPMGGAANMALDDALMERARRTGERVFRVYSWSEPTLSLGRHQVARGRIDPAVAGLKGIALVRRPTGGRALLHHREVTYSVTAPLGRDDSVRVWYESINNVLLAALRALGVPAKPAIVTGRTPVPGTASCFVRADDGEISLDGRKLVGSALLRQGDALLQHGSILLDDDQAMLNDLLPEDERRVEPAGTLRQALGIPPSLEAIADALFNALGAAGATVTPLPFDARLDADAVAAERVYGSAGWTFRT
jgi:lipoate-protein ligase A